MRPRDAQQGRPRQQRRLLGSPHTRGRLWRRASVPRHAQRNRRIGLARFTFSPTKPASVITHTRSAGDIEMTLIGSLSNLEAPHFAGLQIALAAHHRCRLRVGLQLHTAPPPYTDPLTQPATAQLRSPHLSADLAGSINRNRATISLCVKSGAHRRPYQSGAPRTETCGGPQLRERHRLRWTTHRDHRMTRLARTVRGSRTSGAQPPHAARTIAAASNRT